MHVLGAIGQLPKPVAGKSGHLDCPACAELLERPAYLGGRGVARTSKEVGSLFPAQLVAEYGLETGEGLGAVAAKLELQSANKGLPGLRVDGRPSGTADEDFLYPFLNDGVGGRGNLKLVGEVLAGDGQTDFVGAALSLHRES